MSRREPFSTKTNSRAIRASIRAAQAVELRVQGYSYAEIAEKLGYKSPYGAWYAVDSALRRLPTKNVETLRQLEIERTEVALRALYPKVVQGEVNAIRRWTELIELQCRILGLFPPQGVEHRIVDDDSDPLFRLLDALARRVEASHVGADELPAPRGTEGDSAE